jgi:hypothetical protein
MRKEQVFAPRITNRARAPRGRGLIQAAILLESLVETDHEAGQCRRVSEAVLAREPGHACLDAALFLVGPRPELEDGDSLIRVAFDGDQDRFGVSRT